MSAGFPQRRLRRFRMKPSLRRLVRETSLSPADLIQPLFACPGKNVRREIPSMPDVFNFSVDQIVEECRKIADSGIAGVILFGIPESKDDQGSGAWIEDGIVQQAIRAIKENLGDQLVVMADTCLCEYTSHGHCGIVHGEKIENDPTLELLAKTAVSQARAGADVIAPSDMMDGRVAAIRTALDCENFSDLPIVSYAVKYSSAFYGPFRDAAQGSPQFGDRKSHQMDSANSREALLEAQLDLDEGADALMVKPALAYLDIIAKLRQEFDVPLAAYHVSGEYSMICAAAEKGWIDKETAIYETTLAIKRAGADFILTYFAPHLAAMLNR